MLRWLSKKGGGALLDLTLFVAAWVPVFLVAAAIARGEPSPRPLYTYTLFWLAILTAAWLPVRLTPLLLDLASLARRRELALTLLTPRQFLVARLRWPVIRILAPVATACPAMVVCSFVDKTYHYGGDSLWFILPLPGVASCAFLGMIAAGLSILAFCSHTRLWPLTLGTPLALGLVAVAFQYAYYIFLIVFSAPGPIDMGPRPFDPVYFVVNQIASQGGLFVCTAVVWSWVWKAYFRLGPPEPAPLGERWAKDP